MQVNEDEGAEMEGRSSEDAFMLGVAAGSAAVLTLGTELCRKEDWRLYAGLKTREKYAPRMPSYDAAPAVC